MRKLAAPDQVFEEHRAFRKALDALDLRLVGAAARGCSDVESAAIVEAVDDFRERLIEHFGLEEAKGYLQEIYAVAPRYAVPAERLLSEHAEVLLRMSAVAERARASASAGAEWDRALTAFRAFAGRLREHEQAEDLLLQRALTEDIGN